MPAKINLRAWNKDNQKMVYSSDANYSFIVENDGNVEVYRTNDKTIHHHIPTEPAQLGSGVFIKQPDGSQQEIYDGDILRLTPEWIGDKIYDIPVEYRNGVFMVEDDFGDYDITAVRWAIDNWDAECTEYAIAGNTYEPPAPIVQREREE